MATDITDLFGRVNSLVEEISNEKSAADKTAMDDPGGQEGASSHPSTKPDDDETQPSPEGTQSSDNATIVKEQTPGVVDTVPEVTPESAPTQDEVQLGQGVDKAKPTGEDPANEDGGKGTKDDPPSAGNKDMGGTTHPASGQHGEKYSADALGTMSDDELFKAAAELGNAVAADMANGLLFQGDAAPAAPSEPVKEAGATKTHCPECNSDYTGNACSCGYAMKSASTAAPAADAAAAGYKAAATAGEPDVTEAAATVVVDTVKTAQHHADLVADYLQQHHDSIQKAAMGGEEDPTGPAAEGENHEGGAPAAPEGEGEGGDLLAAMAGGGGGMPPEAGGMPGEMPPEAGGMPGEMPPEAGGMPGPPDAMGGMGDDEAIQQLAMALLELGIDPAELAAVSAEPAPKMAAAVDQHKRHGKFIFEEAKQGSAERQVRDYMKQYVGELFRRTQS